ncbi:MAG: VOC family protein [Paludibacterium sp.]|uniref:VOC family protein n=1 Tax=Paludibacterium sp. TaxID=1917523 RepID=UPI0025FA5A6E|nr:VOC family protein [Paludibacterium sp.]MBV8048214.1 VOC family protein [Paludibacterium sp.]MBV8648971.1 VOC family protein [Paludibacterium sp.]
MQTKIRIARPVSALAKSAAMYTTALGFIELGRFEDHAGFDGIMLGRPGENYHFEFTYCRSHPVKPAPTPEDLLVFYVPDEMAWQQQCAALLQAGFVETSPFNPYWQVKGRTFADHDGYRVVIQRAQWA